MGLTKGRIDREGLIRFHDAKLAIWEEGISEARKRGGWAGEKTWERQFKQDVFKRIIQAMNRLGWTVGPQTHIFTDNNSRYCRKGDLRADLRLCGRHIELDFFQNVNAPDRPDHGGRYQFDKEGHMPYLIRLEMERTRSRIRDYLCNVFTGYVFEPPKISSPNPDPLAYFNSAWNGEYEKHRGVDRFERGTDGWPSDNALSSWSRIDRDGETLNHGDIRCIRDRKGRLLRGRVFGGINGMWMFVYGLGQRDHTCGAANEFFSYAPGMPRKQIDPYARKKRLESELRLSVEAQNFERAAVLRDVMRNDQKELL